MAKKKKLKIAIQGIATSFHEVAALTYFNEPIDTIECLSFHRLCEALKNGEADYAVMAIENSIAGSILPNYFLLQTYHLTTFCCKPIISVSSGSFTFRFTCICLCYQE
jgi:prephenate dehydratase